MDETLPSFPLARRSAFDPPAEYSAAEKVQKVRLYDGRSAWLVVGYDEVREVLSHPAVSADRRREAFPFSSPSREALERADPSFVTFDGPDHARIRRVFTRYFAVRRIQALRPVVRGIVDDLIDELLASGPPADFVRSFAAEVPARTICHFLGLPLAERGIFQELDARRNLLATAPGDVRSATGLMLDLTKRLIESKRTDPGDDLVSELVHGEAAEVLTPEELLHALRLVITAGHETTSNMISLGLVTLLRHHDQWQDLIMEPALVPGAVEELLRYVSIFHISPTRLAVESFQLGGTRIEAGDGLIPVSAGANRDPDAFADPDRFDIRRGTRHHVAFGHGIHHCLGQSLARLELVVVLEQLISRLPGLRLAVPPEELRVSEYSFLKLEELPVSWSTT
ncbi:cytochrome P450 [Microlunatus parietis]|uniref:Pentalenic acid synthase n=1 Tax=Microlunatus parietis TaxID=682979 RepID=A0A7Y9IAV8_9ACTN|nr:cytochrome P450 [Microlunatus parietis]NYE73460.1 pentalenic acid synthase [Microlunatus parietis]